jgi:hypothetical protein
MTWSETGDSEKSDFALVGAGTISIQPCLNKSVFSPRTAILDFLVRAAGLEPARAFQPYGF